jgi:hypothetical protein
LSSKIGKAEFAGHRWTQEGLFDDDVQESKTDLQSQEAKSFFSAFSLLYSQNKSFDWQFVSSRRNSPCEAVKKKQR